MIRLTGALLLLFSLAACPRVSHPPEPTSQAKPKPKPEVAPPKPPPYELKPGHPDGIDKWYLGRQISHVMGHLGAGWLERPEREKEEHP